MSPPPPTGTSGRVGLTRGPSAHGTPLPEAPTVAFFAAFLAGVLNLVEGLALLAGGTEPVSVLPSVSSAALPPLGGIGVAAGIGLVAAGFSLQENPGQRRAVGVALVVLGGISIASGGGFLVGSALAIAGGLVAYLREPMPLYADPVPNPDRSSETGTGR